MLNAPQADLQFLQLQNPDVTLQTSNINTSCENNAENATRDLLPADLPGAEVTSHNAEKRGTKMAKPLLKKMLIEVFRIGNMLRNQLTQVVT